MALLNSAVRAAELLSMNVGDIGESGRIKVTGKGGKDRIVTIGESGVSAVNDYLDIRGDKTGGLWQTITGERLAKDGLRSLFARIENKHPDVFTHGLYAHRFRHTAITRLLRAECHFDQYKGMRGTRILKPHCGMLRRLMPTRRLVRSNRFLGNRKPHGRETPCRKSTQIDTKTGLNLRFPSGKKSENCYTQRNRLGWENASGM